MKIKRIISTVLSTVLLVGVILTDTVDTHRTIYQLTAHAKETAETIATTYQRYIYDPETLVITYLPEVHNFSGVHFTVDANDTSLGSICLSENGNDTAEIYALDGFTITKLELTRGNYDGVPTASAGKVNQISDDVFEITDLNADSVKLTGCTGDTYCTIKEVKVYGVIGVPLKKSTISLGPDNRVASVMIGDIIVPETEYDVTYGKSIDSSSPSFPTEAGVYYAFATAKAESEDCYGIAMSEPFVLSKIEPGAETIATTYQTFIYDPETLVITYLPEVHNFSGVHFAVDANDTSLGSICLSENGNDTAEIYALDGLTITKLELTRGNYDGVPTASAGKVNQISDDVFEITDLNADSVRLTGCTGDTYCTIKAVKIYFDCPLGDVNCDGEITIADAVLLQKWLLAVPDTHLPYWQNADLCRDGRIDAFDLCMMRNLLIIK